MIYPSIHIIGARETAGLDKKPERTHIGAPRMSAHALVQEYLNLHDELYGIVTNGRVLRLLRDSSRLIKLSYLEFDLDRIFGDGLFADFAILYRLLHVSRLPASSEAAAESLIERYHQDSLDSGARIREGLSKAVEQAIRDFADGFLAHPANDELRQSIADGKLKPETYYQHLLRLIYLRLDKEPSQEQASDLGLDIATPVAIQTLKALATKATTDLIGNRLDGYLAHTPQLKLFGKGNGQSGSAI